MLDKDLSTEMTFKCRAIRNIGGFMPSLSHPLWVLAVSKRSREWSIATSAKWQFGLRPDRRHERLGAHDVHYAGEIIGENV